MGAIARETPFSSPPLVERGRLRGGTRGDSLLFFFPVVTNIVAENFFFLTHEKMVHGTPPFFCAAQPPALPEMRRWFPPSLFLFRDISSPAMERTLCCRLYTFPQLAFFVLDGRSSPEGAFPPLSFFLLSGRFQRREVMAFSSGLPSISMKRFDRPFIFFPSPLFSFFPPLLRSPGPTW